MRSSGKLLFGFLMFAVAGPAFGEAEDRKRLKIAGIALPSLVEVDGDGIISGKLAIAVGRVLASCDLRAEWTFYPSWERAMSQVKNGWEDLLVPTIRTSERESFLVFPDSPLYSIRSSLFTRAGHDQKISGLDDLSGKRVGKLRGVLTHPDFDKLATSGAIESLDHGNPVQLIKSLARGRVDYVVGPADALEKAARSESLEGQIVEISGALGDVPVFAAISGKMEVKEALLVKRCFEQGDVTLAGTSEGVTGADQ